MQIVPLDTVLHFDLQAAILGWLLTAAQPKLQHPRHSGFIIIIIIIIIIKIYCHIFYQLYKIDSLMLENKFIADHYYKGLVMATLAKRKRMKASIMVFSSISKRSEHLR
jgi:hypothetical protein